MKELNRKKAAYKMRYSAVIFDKDGVIADSEYCNLSAKHRLLHENGIDVDWSYHDRFLGTSHRFMWTEMKKEFGEKLPESVEYYIARWAEIRYRLVETEGMRAMPGAVACVKKLRAAGIPLALASSSNKRDILSDLAALGLSDGFDAIVSGEECANGKPDPEIFLTAASRLGKPAQKCVVFEDAEAGVKAAKAAGMKCFGYRAPGAVIQNIDAAVIVFSDFDVLTVESILA